MNTRNMFSVVILVLCAGVTSAQPVAGPKPEIPAAFLEMEQSKNEGVLAKKAATAALLHKKEIVFSGKPQRGGDKYLIKMHPQEGTFHVLITGNTCFSGVMPATFSMNSDGNFEMNAEARSKQIRGCSASKFVIDPLSMEVSEYGFYPDTGQLRGPFKKTFERAE